MLLHTAESIMSCHGVALGSWAIIDRSGAEDDYLDDPEQLLDG